MARLLVPEDFGLVALASTSLAILNSLTNLSMASALIHHKSPADDHYHTAWTLGIIRGFVLACIFCVAAWPLAILYSEPRLDDVMYALSASVILNGFTNPRLIKMQKELVFWQVFVLSVANNFVFAVVSVSIAVSYQTYWALVIGTIAGQLTSTVLSYSLFPFRPRFSWKHGRELWSFSMWLTLSQVVDTLNYRFDHMLVGGVLGRASLGFYTVGSSLATVATREAVKPLTQTLFPAFSLLSGDPGSLRNAYQRAQALVTAVALPAGLGTALIADPLVRLAMGEAWAPAIIIVQAIGAIYAFGTLGSLAASVAMAQGITATLFRRALLQFVLRVPLILLGMYYWGFVGLIYARTAVGAITILINMQLIYRMTGLTVAAQLRANIRCLAAGAVMIGAVLIVQWAFPTGGGNAGLALLILFSIVVGTVSYIVTSGLLWLLSGRPIGPESEALVLSKALINLATHRRLARIRED